MVAGLVVTSCSTVGDDDRQHRGRFSEGIHHILAKEWVVAGELSSFVERLGQVPRRRRGIRGRMAEGPVAKRHRWVFALGLRARGRSFRRRGWKPGRSTTFLRSADAGSTRCAEMTQEELEQGVTLGQRERKHQIVLDASLEKLLCRPSDHLLLAESAEGGRGVASRHGKNVVVCVCVLLLLLKSLHCTKYKQGSF